MDYNYETQLENSTGDSLLVCFHHKNTNEIFKKIEIYPYDTIYGEESRFGWIKTNEGMDVVKLWFNTWDVIDTVLIYRNDTLKCIWTAPASGKPDSVHDFFNYNSWKTWLIDKRNGVMMFTIKPEDLKLNN